MKTTGRVIRKWACAAIGVWVASDVVGPLQLGGTGAERAVAVVVVAVAFTAVVLLWLIVWLTGLLRIEGFWLLVGTVALMWMAEGPSHLAKTAAENRASPPPPPAPRPSLARSPHAAVAAVLTGAATGLRPRRTG